LSWGCLEQTVEKGLLPWDITVQVINSKRLDSPAGARYRLIMWDGVKTFKNALLSTSDQPVPPNFSIIKIGTETVPEGTKESVMTAMDKDKTKQRSYAYLFYHYNMVKDGGEVGTRINKPNAQQDLDESVYSLNSTLNSPSANGRTAAVAAASPTMSAANTTLPHTPPNQTGSNTAPPPYLQSRSHSRTGGTSTQSGGRLTDPTTANGSGPSPLRRPINIPASVKRNLNESYPPENKRPNNTRVLAGNVESENATHVVASLNPMMNKYSVKVRVSEKSELKDIQSPRWQGKICNAKLSDKSGDIIIKGFNADAEALHKELNDGSTYIITGALVKPVRDSRYNNTGHNYELTWSKLTKVSGPFLHSAISLNYKFVPISSIIDLDQHSTVDVCGWVRETGDLIEFRSKNDNDLKKRDVVLQDDSTGANSVTLTLWGELAENFNYHNRVITIKGAKVKEFNSIKNLNIGFSGSYEVEPDVPGVQELVEWAATQEATQPLHNTSSGMKDDFTTIQDLKDTLMAHKGEKRCRLYGWVTHIRHENIIYRAHTPQQGNRCQKKILETAGRLECVKCGIKNIPIEDTTLRFSVRVCISDCTESAWCSAFDAAEFIFGKTAEQLNKMKEEDQTEFETYISDCSLRPFVFHVVAKIETYNDAPQLKLILNKAENLGWNSMEQDSGNHQQDTEPVWKELARSMRKEIINLEKELGVDHKDVVNTTWSQLFDNI